MQKGINLQKNIRSEGKRITAALDDRKREGQIVTVLYYGETMKDQLRTIKNILRKDRNIEFAYLFGSHATGAAGPGSDWDIAVFYTDNRNISPWRRFYLEAELSRVLGSEVQVTVLNSLASPLFLFEVIDKGTLLVDRNTGRRVVFEARQVASYHDWRYFQDRRTAL